MSNIRIESEGLLGQGTKLYVDGKQVEGVLALSLEFKRNEVNQVRVTLAPKSVEFEGQAFVNEVRNDMADKARKAQVEAHPHMHVWINMSDGTQQCGECGVLRPWTQAAADEVTKPLHARLEELKALYTEQTNRCVQRGAEILQLQETIRDLKAERDTWVKGFVREAYPNTADDDRCRQYWNNIAHACVLRMGHEGEHYYLVPGYAIRGGVDFKPPAESSLKAAVRKHKGAIYPHCDDHACWCWDRARHG